MKTTLDPSLDETSRTPADVRKIFEKVWRELQARESAEPDSDLSRSKVWLECDGGLVEIGSVQTLAIREPVPGVEFVDYVCPHCNQSHESLRFR